MTSILYNVPEEIISYIFSYVSGNELNSITSLVCHQWYAISNQDFLWLSRCESLLHPENFRKHVQLIRKYLDAQKQQQQQSGKSQGIAEANSSAPPWSFTTTLDTATTMTPTMMRYLQTYRRALESDSTTLLYKKLWFQLGNNSFAFGNPPDHVQQNGTLVHFRKLAGEEDDDTLDRSVQTTTPMNTDSIVSYFEVKVINEKTKPFSVGLCCHEYPTKGHQPGWEVGSIGYHGDDGMVFRHSIVNKKGGETFGAQGDIIGVGQWNPSRIVFFTKNGALIRDPVYLSKITEKINLHGIIGLWEDCDLEVNFGKTAPFSFDVSTLLDNEQFVALNTAVAIKHQQSLEHSPNNRQQQPPLDAFPEDPDEQGARFFFAHTNLRRFNSIADPAKYYRRNVLFDLDNDDFLADFDGDEEFDDLDIDDEDDADWDIDAEEEDYEDDDVIVFDMDADEDEDGDHDAVPATLDAAFIDQIDQVRHCINHLRDAVMNNNNAVRRRAAASASASARTEEEGEEQEETTTTAKKRKSIAAPSGTSTGASSSSSSAAVTVNASNEDTIMTEAEDDEEASAAPLRRSNQAQATKKKRIVILDDYNDEEYEDDDDNNRQQ